MAYSYTRNNECVSSISAIPSGRYSIYCAGLIYNKETILSTVNLTLIINVNGDNANFDTRFDRSWSDGVRKLDGESTMLIQAATELFLEKDNNTVQLKSILSTGSSITTYSNRHHINISKKYIQPISN